MNSLLRHALSHPIYSLVAALLTGLVSAWSTSTLFYDAHHGLTWFDIGLFLPVVLIAASAKASNDLTNRNRQIALYLVGYLSLLWYQAPEAGVQILVKGAIVAIVVYAVVRSSTPIFDDWKTENPVLRSVGILAVIIGSLINSYLDGKSGYAGFAELFFPSFLAILSARILITRFNIAQDNYEPFKLYFLIPVALLIGQILFLNFASEAFFRPGIIISLALLSAAISLPYRLFCLFLPTAILINAIQFSINPYIQDIVTDKVLLTLAVVALTSSLIASMIQKLKKSEASLLKSAIHLSQAVNRFEKISSVTDISLFEQIDAKGSLWCNSQLHHFLETPNQTLLTVNDLLEKLTLNDSPVHLESITPQEGVPFKAIVTVKSNGNSEKKALITVNRDKQGLIYGSLVDQTEMINRGTIAITAMKQVEQFEEKNKTLISTLQKASENANFDLASINVQEETISFAFSGRSIKFPGDSISLEEFTSRVKRSHRETLSYLLEGRIENCELALDLSRTETIWWKVVRVRFDDQKIEFFIQDISLAKRTQDRFMQSRGEAELAIRKLNITTDTSGIGLFEVDPINEKLRPSATLREMINLPQSEKISIRGFLGLFDENSNQDFLYTFQNLTKLQGSKHFNVTINNGEENRFFDVTLTSQGLLAVDRQILGCMIETTDRQKLIEESKQLLHQSNLSFMQLQERFESEKRLFGIIAHEIRTPVSAIKMMLEDDIDHSDDINHSVNHLLELIDDLRNVVKPEQQTARQRKAGQLSKTVQEVCNSMQSSAKEAKIDLCLTALDWQDPETYFDTTSLRQMVINLLRNAFLHSGASEVAVEIFEPAIEINVAHYSIKISDNGKGISKEYQANLFDAYYRGDSKADGSGIGLYLCMQIANELGGTIQYEDTPGGGATFLINLAVDLISTDSIDSESNKLQEIEQDAATDTINALDLSNKRVLVAEDNLMIRTLTKKMLEGLGAEVVAEEDGQLALNSAKESKFDLVVTDIFMPNLDGYGLTSGLREIGFTGPIVGVSAATIGEERDRLIDAGASIALAKPISVEKLTEALQSIDQSI